MRIIARSPLEMVAGGDRRPGDTFDCPDDEAKRLVADGRADEIVEPKPAKGKPKGE